MKKNYCLILLVILFSCSNDDKDSTDEIISEGNTVVDIQVVLPEEATYSINNLELSSLFETKQLPNDGITNLEIFNGENLEFNVVRNSAGSPILMGMLDPETQGTQTINALSTAQSLIIVGPWALGLSKSQKLQALSIIPTINEFDSFLTEVEQAIINQDLSLLNPGTIQEQLSEQIANRNGDGQINTQFYPHDIYVDTEVSVSTMEDVNSNASYHFSLYRYTNLVDEKLLLGNLDSQLVIDLLFTGTTNSDNRQDDIIFNFEQDGIYELRARNGWSFSEEHREAFYQNFSATVYEIIGIFTGAFSNLFSNNAQCLINVVDIMKSNPELQVIFNQFKNGEIDGLTFTTNVLTTLYNVFSSSTSSFSSCNFIQNNSSSVLQMLSYVIGVYQSGAAIVNTGSIIYDWSTLPQEYNACIVKSDGNNSFCDAFEISSDEGFDFGNIPVGQEISRLFTITNTTDFNLTVDDIIFESDFYTNNEFTHDLGSAQELDPGESIDFNVFFNGDGIVGNPPFSLEMIISNNIDEINNTVTLNGQIVNALTISPLELNFGTVVVNEQSTPQTITIENTSDYATDVSISGSGVPNGYSVDPLILLTEVPANSSINFDVTFLPTSTFEDYSSVLEIISNDSSQQNLIILLSGEAEESNEFDIIGTKLVEYLTVESCSGDYETLEYNMNSYIGNENLEYNNLFKFNNDGTLEIINSTDVDEYNIVQNNYTLEDNQLSFVIESNTWLEQYPYCNGEPNPHFRNYEFTFVGTFELSNNRFVGTYTTSFSNSPDICNRNAACTGQMAINL